AFDYVILSAGLIAAINSGVAVAMVNLIIGNFITIMAEFTASSTPPSDFMPRVFKTALYFVYDSIGRFVCIYVYSSLLTYSALNITRNLRYQYLKSALGQEVGFFEQGIEKSISIQATSNGKLIQSGISQKFGQVFQAISAFIASFIIAFISQRKLTLILTPMVPALVLVAGTSGALDAGIETNILKIVIFAIIMAASIINSLAPHIVTSSRAGTTAESGDIPLFTTGSIELKGIAFSYPTRPNLRVLDNYSLLIPASKVTALVR
ncbi:hypothetical protein KAF25_011019, partial [Fusarium avenaceum]